MCAPYPSFLSFLLFGHGIKTSKKKNQINCLNFRQTVVLTAFIPLKHSTLLPKKKNDPTNILLQFYKPTFGPILAPTDSLISIFNPVTHSTIVNV